LASSTFLPRDPRVDEPYRLTPQAALRIAVLGGVALLVFGALFLRLWALQILSGHQYLRTARNNQLRTLRLDAPRGPILDRNGHVLVDNVSGWAVDLWPADLPKTWPARIAELRALSKVVHAPVQDMLAGIAQRKGDPLTPVTVKVGVHQPQLNYLDERREQFPGVQITPSFIRHYPYGAVASQLLGYVGEISQQQLKHAGPNYRSGDKVGESGVESAFDAYLRGRPGLEKVRVDARGNVISGVTQAPSVLPAPGQAVRLTIDVRLQQAAQNALQYGIERARADNCYGCWDANGGAIVALDPHDGSILALASAPTYDPNVYSGRVTQKRLAAAGLTYATAKAKNYPALNRALVGLYPPGSTFKPVTALAAMESHIISPYTQLLCSGSYTSPEDLSHHAFQNWDPNVSQWMDLPTALAYSCDTYFYQLGDDFFTLPPGQGHPLQAWAQRFGFGETTGVDVGPEAAGLLPTPEWRLKTYTKKTDPKQWRIDRLWKPGDSIQLAIGQKDLEVTPLQMARFYALIANGGKLVTPHVLLDVEQPGAGAAAPHPAPRAAQPTGVDKTALQFVRQGLYEATHASFGTSAAVFSSFPVAIAGKTGTAEKAVDPGDGIFRLFNQSWWCGYGPADGDPSIVVCAVIENGGHGGTAAAPAALKVFEQFFHKTATGQGTIHSD
jgi:penicillin-binding protein 2